MSLGMQQLPSGQLSLSNWSEAKLARAWQLVLEIQAFAVCLAVWRRQHARMMFANLKK
jgi:hypothetical protein